MSPRFGRRTVLNYTRTHTVFSSSAGAKTTTQSSRPANNPGFHRRYQRTRKSDRSLAKLAQAVYRLDRHHGSTAPSMPWRNNKWVDGSWSGYNGGGNWSRRYDPMAEMQKNMQSFAKDITSLRNLFQGNSPTADQGVNSTFGLLKRGNSQQQQATPATATAGTRQCQVCHLPHTSLTIKRCRECK